MFERTLLKAIIMSRFLEKIMKYLKIQTVGLPY